MKVITVFWLSVSDEGYYSLLTECIWWRLLQSFDWVYLMKVITVFWQSVSDEGYCSLLTECIWWRLCQKRVLRNKVPRFNKHTHLRWMRRFFSSYRQFSIFRMETILSHHHMAFTFLNWFVSYVISWSQKNNLHQGYRFHKLLKTFTWFYNRYKDLVHCI